MEYCDPREVDKLVLGFSRDWMRYLLTTAQASAVIGCHPRTLIKWVLRGKIVPCLRGHRGRGRTHYWSRRQVEFLRLRWTERTEDG